MKKIPAYPEKLEMKINYLLTLSEWIKPISALTIGSEHNWLAHTDPYDTLGSQDT